MQYRSTFLIVAPILSKVNTAAKILRQEGEMTLSIAPYLMIRLRQLAKEWKDADKELEAARELQSRVFHLKFNADQQVYLAQQKQRSIQFRIMELINERKN